MTVEVVRDVREVPLDDGEVIRVAGAALDHGSRPGLAIAVVLVDDATLTDLHARFLDDPTPTDVIAFELGEEGGGPAAEVYVSVECARRVALERGRSEAQELALYIVHGSLHLCGFDDRSDDDLARMRAAERAVLERLGYAPDEDLHGR